MIFIGIVKFFREFLRITIIVIFTEMYSESWLTQITYTLVSVICNHQVCQ